MSDETSSEPATVTRAFLGMGGTWRAIFLGIITLTLLDVGLVASRMEFEWVTGVRYGLSSVALGAWVSITLAWGLATLELFSLAVGSLGARLPSRLRGALGSGLFGLLAAGAGLVVLKPWNLALGGQAIYALLPCTGIVVGLSLWLLRRLVGPWAYFGIVMAGSAASFMVDAYVYRFLYNTFHSLATFISVVLAMLAWQRVGACTAARGRVAGLIGLALVAQLALLVDATDLRAIGFRHGSLQPRLLAFEHVLLDFDRDGYASLLGGADCDDGSPAVRPDSCELFDNGVDDNCNGLYGSTPRALPPTDRKPAAILPDIYLVLVDALRGDLGRPEDPDALAPNIRAFSRRNTSFTNAHTPYPETSRATTCLAQARSWRYVGKGYPMIFEVLSEAGYDAQLWKGVLRIKHTEGSPDPVRDWNNFHHKTEVPKESWTASIIDDAIGEMVSGQEEPPRFRWLHLMDTHMPLRRGEPDDTPIQRYRAELRHVDTEFGRFIKALNSTERGRRAVVVLTADHGEGFGEHGAHYHGSMLFEELIRIPLIFRLPGEPAEIIGAPASLIDLLPTVAGFVGLPQLPHWQGRNWAAKDRVTGPRVLSEVEGMDNWGGLGLPIQYMAMDRRYKLIVNVTANVEEFYDLERDPGEVRPLPSGGPRFAALRDAVAHWADLPGCHPPRASMPHGKTLKEGPMASPRAARKMNSRF